jgi:hypothetical protein
MLAGFQAGHGQTRGSKPKARCGGGGFCFVFFVTLICCFVFTLIFYNFLKMMICQTKNGDCKMAQVRTIGALMLKCYAVN